MPKSRIASIWVFLWSAAAAGIFVLLQLKRIAWSDRVVRDIQWTNGAHALSPEFVLRWGPGGTGSGLATAMRLPDERPMFIVGLVALAAGMAAAGWIAASTLSAVASLARLELRHSVTTGTRLRVGACAVNMAWPWAIGLGFLVGAASWFVVQHGRTSSLIEGLRPTLAQAGAILAAWSALFVPVTCAFHRRAAAAVDPLLAERCLRCRYPRSGLAAAGCPECGTPFPPAPPPQAPSAWRCHFGVAKALSIATALLLAAVAVLYMSHQTVRDWLALRCSDGFFLYLGTLVSGADAVTITNLYGEVSLRAEHSGAAAGSGKDLWTVQWHFTPSAADSSHRSEASGTLVVLDHVWPGMEAKFPFGELWFGWRPSADPGLLVGGTPLLFKAHQTPGQAGWTIQTK